MWVYIFDTAWMVKNTHSTEYWQQQDHIQDKRFFLILVRHPIVIMRNGFQSLPNW